MRCFAFLCLLMLGAPAQAEPPQWLTLPPTPSLPKPVQSGYAPVNGIKIWYATFGRGEPVILLHGGLANSELLGQPGARAGGALPRHRHGQPRPRPQHPQRPSPMATI